MSEREGHNPDQLNLGRELQRKDRVDSITAEDRQKVTELEARASGHEEEWDRIDGTGQDTRQQDLATAAEGAQIEAGHIIKTIKGTETVIHRLVDATQENAADLDDPTSQERFDQT